MPLPPLSEQRRIVEILDQADALRKKRAEADAKAARILPALFYKMFGDPATNPMGWRVGTLADVIIDLRYGTSVRCDSIPAGLPVLRIPNIVNGRIEIDDLKYANLEGTEKNNLLLNRGDILFIRTNGNREYVGRCAVFELRDDYLYASYLIRARIDMTVIDPKFLTVFLNTATGRQAMQPFIRTTAGQSNISQEGLRQIPMIFPPLEKQLNFRHKVEEIERMSEQKQRTSKGIEDLFATLLHRAFTGDLTAKWREAHLEELLAEMEEQTKVFQRELIK
jgi:type I restriction enzyme S subunit